MNIAGFSVIIILILKCLYLQCNIRIFKSYNHCGVEKVLLVYISY